MNFLKNLIFLWKKPQVVIVTGQGRACATGAIFQVLRSRFKTSKILNNTLPFIKSKKEVLIFEADLTSPTDVEKFKFLVKKSRLPILIATHVGEIPPDQDFFAGELNQVKEITDLAESLPARGHLILNFDDETVREIKNRASAHSSTFGFQEGADFRASDIRINNGTNFKVNYKGSIVPCWLGKLFGKEQTYAALAATSVGAILDLNLVEVSQSLKSYQGFSGRMRLIGGIKNSQILDDSESASSFSMMEALEILGKIDIEGLARSSGAKQIFGGRRIAVLGDILGIGKYSVEVHEAIGEKAVKAADLLFTIGPRAKFFAKGASIKGMPEDKIFSFDDLNLAARALQEEIKEGDLILVDGSKEMEMSRVVEEIKEI